MSAHGHSWSWHHGAMSTHELSRVLMAPWNHTLVCSWVTITVHECSSEVMSAQEFSLLLMSARVHESTIMKKFWLVRWSLSSVLPLSRSRFYQIIKSWIFLRTTQKGLLENVQDKISRPLGSWEIQQTKAETVLVDNLYIKLKATTELVLINTFTRSTLLSKA